MDWFSIEVMVRRRGDSEKVKWGLLCEFKGIQVFHATINSQKDQRRGLSSTQDRSGSKIRHTVLICRPGLLVLFKQCLLIMQHL